MLTSFNVHEIWNIFFNNVTISDFSELGLLKTSSKSDSTSSKDILISGVFMNPKES